MNAEVSEDSDIEHRMGKDRGRDASRLGRRGDTSIKKRVECDLDYIENWSFQFDLKIIWLTVFGRKTNRNAY